LKKHERKKQLGINTGGREERKRIINRETNKETNKIVMKTSTLQIAAIRMSRIENSAATIRESPRSCEFEGTTTRFWVAYKHCKISPTLASCTQHKF
jgi:hypothetical protein